MSDADAMDFMDMSGPIGNWIGFIIIASLYFIIDFFNIYEFYKKGRQQDSGNGGISQQHQYTTTQNSPNLQFQTYIPTVKTIAPPINMKLCPICGERVPVDMYRCYLCEYEFK
jgi:hypothetical protein